MGALISILIFIDCLLLIGVILIQNSKGGGLASGFSSSNQFLGVRKTTDVLEKATWGFAVALVVLCLLSAVVDSAGTGTSTQVQESELSNSGLPPAQPAPGGFPQTPAETAPPAQQP